MQARFCPQDKKPQLLLYIVTCFCDTFCFLSVNNFSWFHQFWIIILMEVSIFICQSRVKVNFLPICLFQLVFSLILCEFFSFFFNFSFGNNPFWILSFYNWIPAKKGFKSVDFRLFFSFFGWVSSFFWNQNVLFNF